MVNGRLVKEGIVEAGNIDIIRPYACNLHSYVGIEDSAFFNIYSPHYDQNRRFLNFYEVINIDK